MRMKLSVEDELGKYRKRRVKSNTKKLNRSR